MFVFYFASSRVIRSVPYGKKPRQRLDIFVPKNHWKLNDGLIPVVIYVTGMLQPVTEHLTTVAHKMLSWICIACCMRVVLTAVDAVT